MSSFVNSPLCSTNTVIIFEVIIQLSNTLPPGVKKFIILNEINCHKNTLSVNTEGNSNNITWNKCEDNRPVNNFEELTTRRKSKCLKQDSDDVEVYVSLKKFS